MSNEYLISVKTNGGELKGWHSAKITRSLAALSGSFEVSYYAKIEKGIALNLIKRGDSCKVFYKNMPLIDGYVEKRANKASNSQLSFSVSGRDKTGDLVDSTAALSSKEFKNQSLKQMAETLLSGFNISISGKSSKANTIIKNISMQPTETIFNTISKLAKYQNVLVYPDRNGGLIFSDVGTKKCGKLEQGKNILELDIVEDDSQKFQTYKSYVNEGTPDEKHKKSVAEVRDPTVKRPRIKLIALSKASAKVEALERCKWEMMNQTAKSLQLNVTVVGWLNPNGELWEINEIVTVDFKCFEIRADFLIEETVFNFDTSGYKTNLKLVIPEAYKPQESRSEKSLGNIGAI
ncbi:phage baseplate assembly protein [Silvanigrella sp.]|jgi:prophage tail gpP-like protein|uniref:phage baseplate assembly protein n=1 Tax=Silvanigrella sp. TaxID=2024976 RepID=UPI0037C4F50E